MSEMDVFHISFDTRDMQGRMTAVKVTLEREILDMNDPKILKRSFRINLADHPLYLALQAYVKANPR